LNARDFASVFQALVARHGKPDHFQTEAMPTRAGGKLENVTATWLRGGTGLTVTKYQGNIETSSVLIASERGKIEFERRMDESKKGAKGR